ncbi:MAG: RNA-protein complex protein Nop10 [Bacteroidales bacterium]|nr:RNA-protein complex protein Nop10 [Bacteroidales bacterium]
MEEERGNRGGRNPIWQLLILALAIAFALFDSSDANSCSRKDTLHKCEQCNRYTDQSTCPYCHTKVVK